MTRRFLMALFAAPLAAQTTTAPLVNDQCPVCKTVAPGYTKAQQQAGGMCSETQGRLWVESCLPNSIIIIRCANCNNAFWQEVSAS